MDITLDSNAMNHLTRRVSNGPARACDALTRCIEKERIRVVVDRDSHLMSEWRRTAPAEFVGVLVAKWEACGGMVTLKKRERMKRELKQKLRALGFDGTIDKVVVEIALSTTDRHIVSSDGDFYDPKDTAKIGDRTAVVAKLLREEEEVTVETLGQFLGRYGDKR